MHLDTLGFSNTYFLVKNQYSPIKTYHCLQIVYKLINTNIVFNRSNRLRTKDGKGKVHLYVSFDRKPSYYDTEILLLPTQWNDVKKIVVGHIDSDELNEEIEDLVLTTNRYYRKRQKDKKRFTVSGLFKHLDNQKYNSNNDLDFLKFAKDLHQSEVMDLALSTAKKRIDLFNRLDNYQGEIYFSEIDIEFIDDFKKWLFKQESNRGKTLGANYISSLFVLMKKFVRAARIKGLILDDPFLGFKINKTAKVITVLNEDEVELIWNYSPIGKLKRVRRKMLFLFYTGMRVGDIHNLTEDNFKDGMLKFLASKTAKRKGKEARIPMHLFDNRAYELFENGFTKQNNYDLNTGFRELLGLVGIDKYMTVHDARHTFKSIMLERGYPLHIIAEFMAHSSTTTTAKYGSISDKAVMKQLKGI